MIHNLKSEFVSHPQDSLLTGDLPVLVQCTVKNALRDRQSFIECNGKRREINTKREMSQDEEDNQYETLTLFISRKEFETPTLLSNNRHARLKRLACRCVAYSMFDHHQKLVSNKAVIRNAFLESEFHSEPMDERVSVGEPVEMRCDPPRGEPAPSVYWLKDNKEVIDMLAMIGSGGNESSRIRISNDFSLLILAAKRSDSGSYVCVATNTIEKRYSRPATLVVVDRPKNYTWSNWTDWSTCDHECLQYRVRHCLNEKREVVDTRLCPTNDTSSLYRYCDRNVAYECWKNTSTKQPISLKDNGQLFYNDGIIESNKPVIGTNWSQFFKSNETELVAASSIVLFLFMLALFLCFGRKFKRENSSTTRPTKKRALSDLNLVYFKCENPMSRAKYKIHNDSSTTTTSVSPINNQKALYDLLVSTNSSILPPSTLLLMSDNIPTNNTNYCDYDAIFHKQDDVEEIINKKMDQELAYDVPEITQPYTGPKSEKGSVIYYIEDHYPSSSSTSNMTLSSSSSPSVHHSTSINHQDLCLLKGSTGGMRLNLDCGISLFVPDGALPPSTSIDMFLGVCRSEQAKPRLSSPSSVYLSDLISIGPSNLSLLKPAYLTIANSHIEDPDSWNISLFSSFNSDWSVQRNINSESNTSNLYFTSIKDHFILSLERLGRYCLMGEVRKCASKLFRLVVFSNRIDLNVYLVENSLSAFQEILRIEKSKTSSCLLEVSETFACSSQAKFISLLLDTTADSLLTCSRAFHELNLSQLWQGRVRYCVAGFGLCRANDGDTNLLNCRIRAYMGNEETSLVDLTMSRVLYDNRVEPSIESVMNKWNLSSLLSPRNSATSYVKIKSELKSKLCTLLDQNESTRSNRVNWTCLARELNLGHSLHYFAVRASPTETLLAYYEVLMNLDNLDVASIRIDLANLIERVLQQSVSV